MLKCYTLYIESVSDIYLLKLEITVLFIKNTKGQIKKNQIIHSPFISKN